MFPRSRAFPSLAVVVHGIVVQAWASLTIAANQLVAQGKERARLKGCGGGTEPVDATLRLDDSSGWSLTLGAAIPSETTLSGSDVAGGRRDRRVTLETDATGIAALAARVGAIAIQRCGASTGVDSLEIKTLRLSRGRQAATPKLVARFVTTTGKHRNETGFRDPWPARKIPS